eukprot:snap_masked-scaffold_23-processed-gene-1.25-mRNA-1 protein AED:1.00 eAED:1.00 QI:0/0/0/0/1/1/2/0/200
MSVKFEKLFVKAKKAKEDGNKLFISKEPKNLRKSIYFYRLAFVHLNGFQSEQTKESEENQFFKYTPKENKINKKQKIQKNILLITCLSNILTTYNLLDITKKYSETLREAFSLIKQTEDLNCKEEKFISIKEKLVLKRIEFYLKEEKDLNKLFESKKDLVFLIKEKPGNKNLRNLYENILNKIKEIKKENKLKEKKKETT